MKVLDKIREWVIVHTARKNMHGIEESTPDEMLNDKREIGWSIYTQGLKTKAKDFHRKFHFIHHILKRRILNPMVKIFGGMMGKYIKTEGENINTHINFRVFREAWDKAAFDCWLFD